MAKASTFTRTIRRVVKEQVPGHVELNLTPEEASVLLGVLNRVGGPPAGKRGVVDQIRLALLECTPGEHLETYNQQGAIYLK